jgi:hypothetical protein
MKSLLLWVMVAGFALAGVSARAQESRGFTGEASGFANELYFFMQKNTSHEIESALDEFLQAWDKDSLFNAQEKEKIAKTALDLYKKNGRPYPHFTHYLKSLLALKKSVQSPANITAWEKGLGTMLDKRKPSMINVDRFLSFTIQLIDSSSLFHSASVDWRINTKEFRFVADTAFRVLVARTDLICYAKRDSIMLFETSGEYNPITQIWKGNKGTVTWERAGFKRADVFASLDTYVINMTRPEYAAEQAVFTNRFYFSAPLKGVLTDRVKTFRNPEDADYPQFASYQKDFQIRNLYEDINYRGGLSMQGAKMVGTGNRAEQATIEVYRKDTLVLTARSSYFAFKATRINSPLASIVIRLRSDSIYHPGLALTYAVPNRELTLYRTDNFSSQSPYFNSYHKIDMTFDQLVWKMNEPVMRFTALMGSTIGNANFESVNYFNNDKYLHLQLMDEVHPLVSIRAFARNMGTDEFLADDFADYLRKPNAAVKQMLMRMAAQGFIFYDSQSGMATIRPRLNDYLAASVAKIDYDVISIPSRTNAPLENAVFDLRTYDLTINGIPQIFVSDSQNVAIYPANDRIIMKKNRHFVFDGHVDAGLFTIYGNKFQFDYDSFKLGMLKIDSLHIRYLTGAVDAYGFPVAESAQSLILNLSGDLFIDRPDNKSGRKSYPEFPIFHSKEKGYVYYDSKRNNGGVYKRDNFYFRLDPFQLDSLDQFSSKSMLFSGELSSAGIFPPIRETLTLQEDKSMGFKHATEESGLPVYDGKGRFTKEISLSNKGLHGKGNLNYLTASMYSDDFTFYPDSVKATARDFTLAEKQDPPGFPRVESKEVAVYWLPKSDMMYANRTDTTFRMFNGKGTLRGNMVLQPSGLGGEGRMTFEGAEMVSDRYEYGTNKIHADTSDFFLKSLHSDGFTVLTENIRADIDLQSQMGVFSSNEDFTLVSFPENRYVSYLDHFEWNMRARQLAMGAKSTVPSTSAGEEDFAGPRYISIDPAQDSLSFISPVAFYDYDSNLIKATAVKYIDIADARIYPSEQKLTVMSDSRLRTLFNAGLVADRTSRNHSLYNATLNITARKKYTGTAFLDYVDEAGNKEAIFLANLGVDNNGQTIASGEIAEADGFTLSADFHYQGKVFMEASRPLLTFDGSVQIDHTCDRVLPRWINFRSEIEPSNIRIPISDPLIDINRDKIFSGLFLHYDSVHVYPAFLTGRKDYSDGQLVASGGYLSFDRNTQQYLIAQKEKLDDRTLPGNLIALNRETCDVTGEGKLSLGEKMGQVTLTTVGNISYNPASDKTELDVMMGMDFFIADNVMAVMSAEADSMPTLAATDQSRPAYARNVIELIGRQKYEAMRSEQSLFGTSRSYPAELKHTLLFNELKLVWNGESNSWVSTGKIGIASINGVPVNKRVDGLIEIQIKRSGDIMDIYLQLDRRTWYYFGYTRGVMQVHSSNSEFLDKVQKLKATDRRMKVTTGESYIYMISTDVKKNAFLKRYREIMDAQ